MTPDEAEAKARQDLPLAVVVIENWFTSGESLEHVQAKIKRIASDTWCPILLQAAQSIQMKLAQEALKDAGDK